MIEFYHSTCKLNIACNPKIGMRGWQALCRMLRKTPCLTYLDARRTLLTDMTMPTFGRCLKADPPLKILHLEGVFLSGRPMLILSMFIYYFLFCEVNEFSYFPITNLKYLYISTVNLFQVHWIAYLIIRKLQIFSNCENLLSTLKKNFL